jgi:AhpC/TSA family
MSRSDPTAALAEPGGGELPPESPRVQTRRYGRYAGLLALLILALITLNTITTKPNGDTGIAPGQPLAPFAVPLALGELTGDANVATKAGEGAAGNVPACSVRKPQVLNICQLYEKGPVVLALFVDGGSCPAVLSDMQRLVPSFPGVRFAAVSIKGDRGQLRRMVRASGLTFPVGIDSDGVLASLYKVASCPQVSFAYPGGVVQSKSLLRAPTLATLRARVGELVAASRARGWRAPA